MAKNRTIQVYRGTTAQNDAYTGSAGEITMDVTTNTIRIHDGVTLGGHEIGGGASGDYHPDLFDYKWADHLVSDVQWLRGDTFSWQDGGVYEAAYNHLVADHSVHTWGESGGYTTQKRYPAAGDRIFLGSSNTPVGVVASYDSATDTVITVNNVAYTFYSTIPLPTNSLLVSTETIAGTTITFYASPDGHKICTADQESNVAAIYTATGVAWYYILDTTNQRFKLPRTKFGFTGLRSTVGSYVEPGLPNITGAITNQNHGGMVIDTVSGAFDKTTSFTAYDGGYSRSAYNFDFDASRCSSIYGNSTTVQPAATEMYLYFYVGEFTQTAIENTAGLNAELFNNKADLNLLNTANNVDFVIESQEPSAANDYTWYRKYKSGWVEQGGFLNETTSAVHPVTLPIEMADTNYTVSATLKSDTAAGSGGAWANGNAYSTTQIQIIQDYTSTWVGQGTYWTVFGIAA